MLSLIKSAAPQDLAFGALGFFLLYQLYQYLTVGAARRKLIRENGCKPPARHPAAGLYGIRIIAETKKKDKVRKVLENMQQRFQTHGNTMSLQILRQPSQFSASSPFIYP
jgi:hypothetical protein